MVLQKIILFFQCKQNTNHINLPAFKNVTACPVQ